MSETEFWRHTRRLPSGCLAWTGRRSPEGYGILDFAGRNAYAHRVAWLLKRGRIPASKHVLHQCGALGAPRDNRWCVEPAHLRLGDTPLNVRDRVARGRQFHPAGELNPQAKLTERDVAVLRELHAAGVSQAVLAKAFGVSDTTVRRVVTWRTWKRAA